MSRVGSGSETSGGMLHLRSPLSRPEHVQGAVGGDRVEPRADGRSLLEAAEPSPRREQRLLQRVLGVLDRAEDPVAVDVQLRPVGLDQLAERVLVAGLRQRDELRAHAHILPPPLGSVLRGTGRQVDTVESKKWAQPDRPFPRPAGVHPGMRKETRDAAEGQGCGDLRSRRRDRWRRRTRVRLRRGRLFLTGRSLAPVELVAKEIVAAGGSADAAEVDSLDEQAIDDHLDQ